MALQIYREIVEPSPSLLTWLEERDQVIEVNDPKGKPHLFIDNDYPRPADITREIVGDNVAFPGCTKGFAVFDDEGNFIAQYSTIVRAMEAVASAKVVMTVEVPDEAPDDDQDI